MISYIIPTRNRPAELAWTLEALSTLGDHHALGGAEVIVVDNESAPPVRVGPALPSGVPVRVLRPGGNHAAGARNVAAAAADARSTWLVMLDDDSHPLSLDFAPALLDAPPDVAALAADIRLPAGGFEAGGLPEVFIGCGVAIRREVFLGLGGYDASFDYYAEEYDLAARMIRAGLRIVHEPRFRVLHRKVTSGRDFARIVARLTRNNAWIMQRYAPLDVQGEMIAHTLQRYREIARREGVPEGFERGQHEWEASRHLQPALPLSSDHWDRFTGLAAARDSLHREHQHEPLGRVALVHEGKNAWCVRHALNEMFARDPARIRPAADPDHADTLVIATLSPGPTREALARCDRAFARRRVIAPGDVWTRPHAPSPPLSGVAGTPSP